MDYFFYFAQSIERARRIIQMYADEGISRDRILIKLAATWEGICAAEVLEKEGITCNLTLVFGTLQVCVCVCVCVCVIQDDIINII